MIQKLGDERGNVGLAYGLARAIREGSILEGVRAHFLGNECLPWDFAKGGEDPRIVDPPILQLSPDHLFLGIRFPFFPTEQGFASQYRNPYSTRIDGQSE